MENSLWLLASFEVICMTYGPLALLSFIHPSHDVPWALGVGHDMGVSTGHR